MAWPVCTNEQVRMQVTKSISIPASGLLPKPPAPFQDNMHLSAQACCNDSGIRGQSKTTLLACISQRGFNTYGLIDRIGLFTLPAHVPKMQGLRKSNSELENPRAFSSCPLPVYIASILPPPTHPKAPVNHKDSRGLVILAKHLLPEGILMHSPSELETV